jgi:hypothetical protein
MQQVIISSTQVEKYINLTAISGLSGSIVVTNNTASPAYVVVSSTEPPEASTGILALSGEEVFVNNAPGLSVWIKSQKGGPVIVQSEVEASAEFRIVSLPKDFVTTAPDGYRRIRVDVSETGFFIGTQFRTFKELSIASGTSYYVRVVSTTNLILMDTQLAIDAGSVRMTLYASPTPSGTWSESWTVVPANQMTTRPTPIYTSGVTITAGGTFTGGTVGDIVRVVSANATAQQSSVGNSENNKRGYPPGTYYYKLENIGNGTATGTYHSLWEERP